MRAPVRLLKVILILTALLRLEPHGSAFAQGSLTPLGAPAPTMKTLQQVEPRVPIASLTFTINQPGSYYLVSNLTQSAAANGITIGASDVTLDLNGFVLAGTNSIHDGITTSGTRTNICIRNGTIRNWRMGVTMGNARNGVFEDLRFIGNSVHGLNAGTSARVSECVAGKNGGDGIRTDAECLVERCSSSYNGTNGISVSGQSVVRSCEAIGNAGDGISARLAQPVLIVDCYAAQNTGDGIRAQVYSMVQDNHSTQNVAAGIHITGGQNRIDSNHTGLNGTGVRVDNSENLIFRNTASNNGTNYSLAVGNMVGPTNASPGVVTTHPWANFAF